MRSEVRFLPRPQKKEVLKTYILFECFDNARDWDTMRDMQLLKMITGLVLVLLISFPVTAKAVTIEDLQAQIADLMRQIQELQVAQPSNLVELITPIRDSKSPENIFPEIPADFLFKESLDFLDEGLAVKYLQIVLNADQDTRLNSVGPGSLGRETRMFGSLTKKASIAFQEKYADEILDP